MSLENYLNWTVSIDCGTIHGNYQGQIKSVDQINQTITLKHTFHNGILLSEDQSDLITISAKDILNLKLLSQPGENFQIPKTILNKSNEQQLKTAPIANNGQKSIGNSSQIDRCRSSKSWSDENDFDYSSTTTTNGSILKSSNQIEEKYRCDQMILQHNNSPINYEQILLPIPTTKKYLTDEGLIIPTINQDFRHRLYHISEQYGFTLDQRIETMGHCINDMSLHLLGGTQRLSVKNRNQYPIIVVLACWNDIQGAYAIAAARILATKNIRIYLYLPLNSNTIQMNFIETQLKLFRSTDGIITHHIQDLPQSPIDLILNGLDNSDSSIRNQFWYNQLVEYSCQVRTSIISIDPPLDVGLIPCKYSLIPLLPLSRNSNDNIGRLYLCDLGFGQKVFQHLQIRYSSPFGAKSFIPLHEN